MILHQPKHMNKRGISELISWVLIIGFSVALGIMVTSFLKNQASSTTEKIVQDTEGDLRCADVSINAFCLSAGAFKITNRGYFTIHDIKIRHGEELKTITINLPPGQESESLNIGPGNGDIIPVIQVEGKLLACIDKKVPVSCS